MAFTRATIQIRPANIGTGIKTSLKRTNKSAAMMSFTINDHVSKSLGWSGGDKIEVLIGDGEHHGLVRLRKNNSVGEAEAIHKETPKGGWLTVRLGHQPAFVDRSESSCWVQWEKIEDGWVEIVLPKWADETAPNRKPPSTPTNATATHPIQPAPKRSVTAAVMGDPPAGRREMLEKIGTLKA